MKIIFIKERKGIEKKMNNETKQWHFFEIIAQKK